MTNTTTNQIPVGWDHTTVGKLVEEGVLYPPLDGNHGGQHPKGDDFVSAGVPFIMASDLQNGSIDLVGCNFISEKQAMSLRKGFAKNGDVLLSHKATLGRTAIVDCKYDFIMLTPQVTYYRIKDETKLSNKFLKYYFDNSVFQRTLSLYAGGGSTRDYIGITNQLDLPVVLPLFPEQKAIADVLSSLDDKIELLRKQNETLEAIAQAIFKEWFVKFNFPDKNGKPYKDSGGRMTDSELGKIPEGWRVDKLSSIADISIGRTPPRKESKWFSTNPKDVKWMSIKDLGNSGVYINNTSEYLTREAVTRFNVPVIPQNTVVVSFKLTVGRVAITMREMLSNEAIAHIKLTHSGSMSVPYIFLFLKQYDFNTLGSTSSIATAVNSKSIMAITLIIPSIEVINIFTSTIDPFFAKIANNTSQIETLARIRDTLLPKLMSGQVRVNCRGGKYED